MCSWLTFYPLSSIAVRPACKPGHRRSFPRDLTCTLVCKRLRTLPWLVTGGGGALWKAQEGRQSLEPLSTQGMRLFGLLIAVQMVISDQVSQKITNKSKTQLARKTT